MRREVRSFILSLAIGGLMVAVGGGNIVVQAQEAQQAQQQKKQQTGLVEDWMDDFEASEDWRAMATCPIGETKIRKIPGKPRPIDENGNEVNYPDTITDENGITHENKYVLGVKTYFMDRGFDRVEVFPPNEYIVRGKAKEIKVWALGRKFRHTLFVKLRDYKGAIHKIKIGRLDFWGWREMSVIVPGWLPQSPGYALLDKNLHFVSFYVESDIYEVPGTFYFYLDNFRVITDLSEFTGDTSIRDNW
ncbi:MAG TPA: flagellar filament outer layer protein FlaA [Spirochaetota bacterium]|nr:flagellar filament outer layer protein FlaA [Spirochaetota bacterium]HOM86876.1 flagellar filament outer layer protein FlaA [Spirochaetota bacterium]HOR92812.1 flagellar filament outer layer protein FlaA [Spirochaetota bacterium]HOT18563.1 flagellar filament outer layer protein FlaA [Spirochaetota bacterium]HPD04468.1 flagellar filament outer layer protein FlaA [Spirochaetota bacterium]